MTGPDLLLEASNRLRNVGNISASQGVDSRRRRCRGVTDYVNYAGFPAQIVPVTTKPRRLGRRSLSPNNVRMGDMVVLSQPARSAEISPVARRVGFI